MTAVALRVALLKQADVHCQLATAQETPNGDANKAIEHYLTAMELLTCAVADKFQLTDARKTAPMGCSVQQQNQQQQQQRQPAFASPLSEVYLQTIVQHKLQQYEERVKLLMEVVAADAIPEVTKPTSHNGGSASPYSYSPHQQANTIGRASASSASAAASTAVQQQQPQAPTPQQQQKQQPAPTTTSANTSTNNTISASITEEERIALEAANPWRFQSANNKVGGGGVGGGVAVTERKGDTANDDIQGALDAIHDDEVKGSTSSPIAGATTAPSSEIAPTREANDTEAETANTTTNTTTTTRASVTRFGRTEVADADAAFDDIMSQFMAKKDDDE